MRQRTFHYNWCGRTETDYVCEHCETIIMDALAGCQHCRQAADRTQARLLKLKGQQQSIEMSEPHELSLF